MVILSPGASRAIVKFHPETPSPLGKRGMRGSKTETYKILLKPRKNQAGEIF
jgi:hypothetical protein